MLNKILVPTDGSNSSKAAFAKAADLARLTGAEIILLHASLGEVAYFYRNTYPLGIPVADDELHKAGIEVINNIIKGLDEGLKISKVTKIGSAAEMILRYAQLEKVDLIIMGSHGHSTLIGSILGSVSQKVLSGASVPVMIVKDPDIKKAPPIISI